MFFLSRSRWTNFPVGGIVDFVFVIVAGAALDCDVLVVAAVVVVVPQLRRVALLQRVLVTAAGSALEMRLAIKET